MAVITRASMTANYSSQGTSKWTPELWSPTLVRKSYAATCAADISTLAYEGEISRVGDRVIIRKIPTLTPAAYEINGAISYVQPEIANTALEISKAKIIALQLDDIDAKQMDYAWIDVMTDAAAKEFAEQKDTDFFADIPAEVSGDNQGSGAGVISGSFDLGSTGGGYVQIDENNALDFVLRMNCVLDEQNVNRDGRWVVLPPWFIRYLKLTDLKAANVTGDNTSPLRNGKVGMIDGLTVYMSNLLDTENDGGATVYQVLAGHPDGVAFAANFTNVKVVDLTTSVGRGLQIVETYGYKVIEPKFLALGRVVAPTST